MYKEGVDFQNDDRNWHDSEMYKERGWGCCCECSNQKTLNGHPWADGNSISTICVHSDVGVDRQRCPGYKAWML